MLISFSKYNADPKSNTVQDAVSYPSAAAIPKPGPGGTNRLFWRDPVPEMLLGDTTLMRAAIRAAPGQHKYRSCVLTFATDDVDCGAFNAGDPQLRGEVDLAVRLWVEHAFAGIPTRCRPPILATTHTHLGALEVNLLVPRWIIRSDGAIRSFNPDPPGPASRAGWDAYEDLLNDRFGWADPRDPARRRLVDVPNWKLKDRAELMRNGDSPYPDPRETLARRLYADVASGKIKNRNGVLERLHKIGEQEGFVIHAVRPHHITIGACDAKPAQRQRLRGLLFSDAFCAPSDILPNPDEREQQAIRRAEFRATAASRLQASWERRAKFNCSRYGLGTWPDPVFEDWEQEPIAIPPRLIPAVRLPSTIPAKKKDATDARPATNTYPDGTPTFDTLAELGPVFDGAGHSAGSEDRSAGNRNRSPRRGNHGLDRFAQALAGPIGPGLIFKALIARLRLLIPKLCDRSVLQKIANAAPAALSVQLSQLQNSLEVLNDTITNRLNRRSGFAREFTSSHGTVPADPYDITDVDWPDHATSQAPRSPRKTRRRDHKSAEGYYGDAVDSLGKHAEISRQSDQTDGLGNVVANPQHKAGEHFQPTGQNRQAFDGDRQRSEHDTRLAERARPPQGSRAELLSQICTARATLPVELADSVRIHIDSGQKPDPHDRGDYVNASDFTYSISIWRVSGKENAVMALLKAVRVNASKPDIQNAEEDQSEPNENLFPEP